MPVPLARGMHWNHKPNPATNAAFVLPLPKGEGRGEGEGTVRQPAAFEVARCNHQPTVHGEGRDTKAVWNLVIGAFPSALSWNNPVSPSTRLLESALRKASWHTEFMTFLPLWNGGCLSDTTNV
jgi:hypothetical protein